MRFELTKGGALLIDLKSDHCGGFKFTCRLEKGAEKVGEKGRLR